MKVEVFHGCPLFDPEHHHKVYEFTFAPASMRVDEEVFQLLNCYPYREDMGSRGSLQYPEDTKVAGIIMPDHELFPIVVEYRNEGHRSLSVGDIIGLNGPHYLQYRVVGSEPVHVITVL